MPQREIRLLAESDVEELRELLRTCRTDTYTGILPDSVIRKATSVWHSKENILREMHYAGAYYAGYVEDGRLCGMISAGKIDDDTVKIFQLYVLPSRQREGIGSRLMETAIGHFTDAKKFVLEVEQGNEKGVSFYRKYGFTVTGTSMVEVDAEQIPCLLFKLRPTKRSG